MTDQIGGFESLPNKTSRYFASFFFASFSSHHFWSVTYTEMAAIRESSNKTVQSRSRNMAFKRKLRHIKDSQGQGEHQGFPSRDNEQTNAKWNWRWGRNMRKRSENILAGEEKRFVEWKKDLITKLSQQKDQTQDIMPFSSIPFWCRLGAWMRFWVKFWQEDIQGVHAVERFCSTKWADVLRVKSFRFRIKNSENGIRNVKFWRNYGFFFLCCAIINPTDISNSLWESRTCPCLN